MGHLPARKIPERERTHKANSMGFLKSKGLWTTVIVSIVTIAAVNRIAALRNFVYGTAN